MKKAAPLSEHDAIVRRINETLEGPVIDVLARLLPQVAALPRAKALEAILDDLELLEACFAAFRANVDLFRHLLIGPDRKPIEDSAAPLICGRSLNEIEAMVLRTAAKRHFRRRLDSDTRSVRKAPRPRRQEGLFARLRALLVGQPQRRVHPKSRADQLYDVINPLLRHDWQVPLVPEYAEMSMSLIRHTGRRLLDYRVPEDVRLLRADPSNPPPPTSVEVMEYRKVGVFRTQPDLPDPATLPRAKVAAAARQTGGMAPAPAEQTAQTIAPSPKANLNKLLGPDGTRLIPGAFADLLLSPQMRKALPRLQQTVKPGEELSLVGADTARALIDGLDLPAAHLAVLLLAAHDCLGGDTFTRAFGVNAKPDFTAQMVARARASGIGPDTSLPHVVMAVTRMFSR